jgi:hypothetical protein
MYRFLLAVLILTLLCRSSAADEQADARVILDKAIKAKGDNAAMAKIIGMHYRLESKYYTNGRTVPIRVELYYQGHDKTRSTITDDRGDFIQVVNGKHGWVKETDKSIKSMSDAQVTADLEAIYVNWVRWLAPLAKAEYRLSSLDETTIEGRKAVGILVRHDEYDAVKLFFDKETNLLCKCELRYMEVESGRELHGETIYSDYRTVRGIKFPFKAESYRDGDKKIDSVCTLVEFSDKPFDDKLFAKP